MSKKILVIDDSKTQLLSLKLIISRAGFEVITAPNAIEGIELAYQNMPDLIISDIVMPSINGYQLCRLLKNDAATKHIPIILLTILEGKIDKFWGLKAGADKFFNKENEPEELIKEIETLLENTPEKPQTTETKNITFTETAYHVKINEILDQSLIESTIINEFRNLSEFINDEKKLMKEISSILESILDFDAAAIFFNSADQKEQKKITLVSNLSKESNIKLGFDCIQNIFPKIDQEELICETIKKNDLNDKPAPYETSLVLPIKSGSEIIGGIGLYSHKSINYQKQKTFDLILNELKLLMQIKHLHSKTKLLTIIDPLTTLYNRRYYQEIIEREFSRAKRYGFDLSIAMFDIDNFKKLNDNYGHQFGDEVLKQVSKIILSSLRNTDFTFRYGGEEIVAILTNSSAEQAFIPIERIRAKIEAHPFEFNGEEVKVTTSAGISALSQESSSSDNLAKLADTALYDAKNSGKNKVLMATNETIS
jgi:two-component system cell cycle response regulator